MNTFGDKFRVSIFGTSHGSCIGVTIDGMLPGMPLSEADFTEDLARRKAGAFGTTPRIEADTPEIVSGLYEGRTTGAPLTILFKNENTRSEDYDSFRENPRPGHADLTANLKYGGFNDPRGGGAFSGRMTLAIVAAGVVAKKLLHFARINASLIEVGGQKDPEGWKAALEAAKAEGDSLGGVVECQVEGLPVGLGEPFWDSVESRISHAIFAIPGVRGIEFGDGFAAARMKGSEHNDLFPEHECHCHDEGHECHHGEEGHHCCHHNKPQPPVTNHAGGINGGLTNGNPVVFRVAFKPTASIAKSGIPGRHDTCFALRTPVIVEAMAALVLVDLAL